MAGLLLAEAGALVGCGRPETLPEIAVSALSQGVECPALLELASLDRPTSADAHPLLTRVIAELGRSAVSIEHGRRRLAFYWARLVVDRQLSPFDGAELIGSLSREMPYISFYVDADDWADAFPHGRRLKPVPLQGRRVHRARPSMFEHGRGGPTS